MLKSDWCVCCSTDGSCLELEEQVGRWMEVTWKIGRYTQDPFCSHMLLHEEMGNDNLMTSGHKLTECMAWWLSVSAFFQCPSYCVWGWNSRSLYCFSFFEAL
jgi:hypothetical protein